MKRLLWLLVAIPVGIVVVVVAVANRQLVTLSLDPFATDAPALVVTLPLYMYLFAALFVGLILGGVGAWMKQGRWRREARERRYEAVHWHKEADQLREEKERARPGPALPAPASRRAA
ncbi:putative integral membrane protein [Rhodobium orientis]|uniref:Lipopolysaccharide assembly protein A domain-containing protein n=1 Tax=Rhodobium orientis TaxID=34017 RepID=A0A327JI75_9HYPH|nr:lipopolysaccharide assembly protein LapA domain-containing protein [Rhodobium orientis]MBB4305618.1 putative integral membrane protein [Rhodobium orientis]MBK5948725.1 hypothetical protein [Rhodobium orientis]RAI24522.1 hypothetical protein CH339_22310 [Rhodobium orientis]